MLKRIISVLVALSILFSFGVFAKNDTLISYTFEKYGEGWLPWSASTKDYVAITDNAASEGKKSLFADDISDATNTGVKSKPVSVNGGETYTALCDMYLVEGTVVFYLRFYNSSGKKVKDYSAKGTKGKWVNLAVGGVAPEGAVTAELIAATFQAGTASFYIDNMKLIKGEVKSTEISGKAPAGSEIALVPKDDGIKDGEMIYSYGFEGGLSPWGYQTDTSAPFVSEVSGNASEGTKSICLKDTSDSAGPGIKSVDIPVTAKSKYTTIADVIGISGDIKLYIKYFDNSGKEITTTSKSVPMEKNWAPLNYVTSAPDGAVSMRVVLCGIKAKQGEAYIDNVRVYKGYMKGEVPEKPYIGPKQVAPVDASIVAPVNNKLVYNTYNEQGDTLSDFSYAGFAAGEYNLPDSKDIPIVMELSPTGTKDDTKMLQDAINKVSNESADNNFKIIKLKAGKYYVGRSGIGLKSGIILSGEGQGPTGTVIYAYDNVKYNALNISGAYPKAVGDKYNISDSYVKSGSKVINLNTEDANNFKVGDLIMIYHPSTQKWVEGMRMVNIESSSGGDNSWKEGDVDFYTERTITNINGGEITLDFPVFVPYNKEYAQSYIYKLDDRGRVENAGVENLRVESYYNGDPEDENHGNQAISITYAKNCFVRDVTTKYFVLSAVSCGKGAKQITILNCSSLDPVSTIQGGRRYAFSCSTYAQQLLYTGCYSYDGRHDYEASFTVTGPIVFSDSVIDKSNSSAETHGTWSTGVLYDNVYEVPNDSVGYLCLANRGIYGTSKSQGWTAGGSVAWNTLSNLLIVHKPPLTYQNFSVGTWGTYEDDTAKTLKKDKSATYRKYFRTTDNYNATDEHYATKDGTSFVGDAYKEAEFTPVNPRSLFKAQLSERITGTISNARPNAPIIVYPRPDKLINDGKVTISGVYQLGATEVNIYVDDVLYKASLKESDNSFALTLDLKEGVHKIYATQVIDGYESTKNADRFIIIGKENGNPDYLQSIYDSSKTKLLINDPRESFDVYVSRVIKENAEKIKVNVNGEALISDVEPYETNGRVLVPMRAIFEMLNAQVEWDEKTSTATATLKGTEVKITENATTAFVNSSAVTLDVPATIKDGRFVVPVRFISESFGASVEWIDFKNTVEIYGGLRYPAKHGLKGELDLADVIQSGDDGAGSVISNVTDNDYFSKWGVGYDDKNPEGAWGIFDFGATAQVGTMHIAFYSGNKRVYTIDIYSSDDGVNFTPVKIGHKSSGTTDKFEEIPLKIKARFVKIVGKGNTVNHWLNLQEVAFTGN